MLLLLYKHFGVHPNGGRKLTPCATFGYLRKSEQFCPSFRLLYRVIQEIGITARRFRVDM